jgi:hypothetical protein
MMESETMRQDYVEYIYRGTLFAENSFQAVSNTLPIPPDDWPKYAVGYRFFHRFEMRETADSGEEVVMRSEARGHTPWTYRGKTRTLAEIAATQPDSVLYRNMEGNGWGRVVDVGGNVWPLSEGDAVIELDYAA